MNGYVCVLRKPGYQGPVSCKDKNAFPDESFRALLPNTLL